MPGSGRSTDSSCNSSNARSPKQRKERLKQALQQTAILQESINSTTVTKLDEAIDEVDNVALETSIQEKVCNQQEVLIDSQMMTSSSKVLKICASLLTKKMRNYDHIEFGEKLMQHLQDESDDSQSPNWSLLEKQVMKLFKTTPNYSTLLGTLEPLEKKEVVRKKPQPRLKEQAAMKVPQKLVTQTNTKEEDSVEQTVRKIKKLITCCCKERQQPLDLFELILHPDDFGKTVRHLLYVSFLVKDGVVKLSNDDKGSLVLQPCRKELEGQSQNKTGTQCVISLNMKQWMVLKEAYQVKQPMIDFDEGN